jgi:uncharacterized membrane protein (UPF0182 family)
MNTAMKEDTNEMSYDNTEYGDIEISWPALLILLAILAVVAITIFPVYKLIKITKKIIRQ